MKTFFLETPIKEALSFSKTALYDLNKDVYDNFLKTYKPAPELHHLKKTDVGYELVVSLPGFGKDEVEITLNAGYIIIKAEKRKQHPIEWQQIFENKIYRNLYVGDVDEDRIEASLENGLLHVILPIHKTKRGIEIKIK